MADEKSKQRKVGTRSVALVLAGFALLVILVWLVDPARVLSVLRNADAKWVGLMLVALITATLLGAINSYLMTVVGLKLNFLPFLGAYWCAWALGQIVPGQIGDLIGISLFLRRRGLALPTAFGRLGADKIISLFCLLVLSTGLIAIYDVPIARIAGLSGACAALALSVAYLLSLRWNAVPVNGSGLWSQLIDTLREAHIVMKMRPAIVATNFALTSIKLLLIGFCYWATFCALHSATVSFTKTIVVANSAGLIAYIPISANGVGTVEAAGIYLFGLLGIAPPVVVAAYLVLRIASLALAFGGSALILIVGTMIRRPSP